MAWRTASENGEIMENKLIDFRTSHSPLAAYLKVKGCEIKEIAVSDTKGSFIFKEVARELIREFNSGNGVVEPGAYASTLGSLIQTAKRMIQEQS